jgi:hypothetical protein
MHFEKNILVLLLLKKSPSFLEIGKGKLTVGKIYGGLLILENWKTTKFGRIPSSQRPVSGNPRTSRKLLILSHLFRIES